MNYPFQNQQFQQNFPFQQQQMMQNQQGFQNQFLSQQGGFGQQQQQFMPQFMPQQPQFMPQFMPQQPQFQPQFQQQFAQQQYNPMQFQQQFNPQMPFMMPMMNQFQGMNLNMNQYQKFVPQWQRMERQQLPAIAPLKENETNENYQFESEFTRVNDYKNEEELEKTFPHLLKINSTNFKIPSKAIYYIIRCVSEDDIHKAIKYQIWTSTAKNNQILSALWRENEKTGIPIYFFFVGEQQILQIKDCNEITDSNAAEELLTVFIDALNEPNLIQKFEYFDRREDVLVNCRDDEDFENMFNKQAKLYSQTNSVEKRIQNEEKEMVEKYAAKDATVNFNDGKQLGEVFVVKSKNKNKGQKSKKKQNKKEEKSKEQEKKNVKDEDAMANYDKERAQPILYESDDQEPEIEKIENKMDYSDKEENEQEQQ